MSVGNGFHVVERSGACQGHICKTLLWPGFRLDERLERPGPFNRLVTPGVVVSRLASTSGLRPPHYANASTSAPDRALLYQPGQQVDGYTVEKVQSVAEFNLTAVQLEHNKTRAKHLHIARDDSNNVFGVAFRTTPMDDTGVAHILEHTALCGSDKFPVRDPFFKMLTRSLSTFMNAFTASDWTMYPFSSQNEQDFRNLMAVYLDACFFPQLKENNFRQEGWRLEHQDPQDPNSPIIFKGIVFNEMKGVFSDSQNVFAQKAQNLLMPGHTYSTVSGGAPLAIPDLSWQQLKQFHASHYHPSNSRFYTYGDLPLEDHLQFIETHALSKFDHIETATSVPNEQRWMAPRQEVISCSPDPMSPDPDKQTTVAVSFLVNDITDVYETFVMSVIGALLTNGEKSPFYQALLEANIGSDFSPIIGYDGNRKEASFSVGLQGIHQDDVTKVCHIIDDTFNKVLNEGFEEERIAAMLHSIELGQKHQTEKFGLYLGVGLLPGWIHGGDPMEALQINEQVSKLKQSISSNPTYLQDKVKQNFLENKHKVTLVMKPNDNYNDELTKEENAKLEVMVSSLTETQRADVYSSGLALIEEQNKEEDLSCLPSLLVSDISPNAPTVETAIHTAGTVPIQLCAQPTNGVTYFRAISNMAAIPGHLKPYVPLFCSVATKMGAGDMDFKQLSQQIDLKTGGLQASTLVADNPSESQCYEQGVIFSSYCLDQNTQAMFDLWHEIFHRLDVTNVSRLETLIRMSAADLASSLAGSGHSYAMGHSASSLTPTAALKEVMGGMTQVELMKQMAEKQDFLPIIEILQEIGQHIFTRDNLRCSLNTTPGSINNAAELAEKFLNNIVYQPDSASLQQYTKENNFGVNCENTHFVLPFQVNYVARSASTVPYTHPDSACLRVLASLMRSKFLHGEIREKGGAYGGGATCGSGVFSFYSYRDPNSTKTLDAFDRCITWASEGNFSQGDIDEAKLSVFQQVDMPVPPGNRGMRLFLSNIDDEMLQQHRQALFAVSKDNLVSATHRYLSTSSLTLLGPENADLGDSWTVKRQS